MSLSIHRSVQTLLFVQILPFIRSRIVLLSFRLCFRMVQVVCVCIFPFLCGIQWFSFIERCDSSTLALPYRQSPRFAATPSGQQLIADAFTPFSSTILIKRVDFLFRSNSSIFSSSSSRRIIILLELSHSNGLLEWKRFIIIICRNWEHPLEFRCNVTGWPYFFIYKRLASMHAVSIESICWLFVKTNFPLKLA